MKEQELKELFKEIQEGPSYGFSTKTMRKINALSQKKVTYTTVRSNSIIGLVVPVILILLIVLSVITTSNTNFEIMPYLNDAISQLTFKENFFSNLGLSIVFAPLLSCLGLWIWIIREKKALKNYSKQDY